MRPFIRFFFRVFLLAEDWVLPPVCLHCGRRRFASLPLCRACLRILRDARPEEDEAVSGMPWIRAAFRLTPPLHALIHGFKYRHQRRHIRFLAAWLRWRRAWILGPFPFTLRAGATAGTTRPKPSRGPSRAFPC
jgi:hypothetical protein